MTHVGRVWVMNARTYACSRRSKVPCAAVTGVGSPNVRIRRRIADPTMPLCPAT
jgi:hypothetical protein